MAQNQLRGDSCCLRGHGSSAAHGAGGAGTGSCGLLLTQAAAWLQSHGLMEIIPESEGISDLCVAKSLQPVVACSPHHDVCISGHMIFHYLKEKPM